MVMAVNGNGKERIENFGRNWTSRKKLEERNCDKKEVERILKKDVTKMDFQKITEK